MHSNQTASSGWLSRAMALLLSVLVLPMPVAVAQAPSSGSQTAAGSPPAGPVVPNAAGATTNESPSWVVRDPRTGHMYRQQLVSVNVARTEWQSQPELQRVYEPQWVQRNVPTQDTIYTPKTSYVTQPRVKGWWNPLSRNIVAYQQVPVTTWQPQTTTINRSIYVQQWVPTDKTVYVPKPVQRTETVRQIVQTEIPQPNVLPNSLPQFSLASAPIQFATRPPLISIPLLGRGPLFGREATNSTVQPNVRPPSFAALPRNAVAQTGNSNRALAANSVAQPRNATSNNTPSRWMRPIEQATSATFGRDNNTAMRATALPSASARSATETGMRATVLR